MRNIKFRAIDETNNWAIGSLVFSPKEKQYYIVEHNGEELSFAILREETIGQYAEVTDKNGEEVYEGDILFQKSTKTYRYVQFEDGSFKFSRKNGELGEQIICKQSLVDFFGLEKVGNCYENPELLNTDAEIEKPELEEVEKE